MINAEETFLALATAKKLYKEHCLKQCFCEKCEYTCRTSNHIDCFEKFFTKNFSEIVAISNSEKSIFK